jgi:hypothetical protein
MTPFEQAQVELRRLATKALHIVRSSESADSKIGGLPYVGDGFVWPTWKGAFWALGVALAPTSEKRKLWPASRPF